MLKLIAAAIALAPATCAAPLAIAAAAHRPAPPIGPTPDEALRCELMMNPNPDPLPLTPADELSNWATERHS